MPPASDIGKRPVSESLPAGTEVRDSAEFDQVQSEIAKLSSLSGDCVVNWPAVVPLCETIITRQGKDLLIACYLAGSLLETRGPAGLSDGLGIVADMLATYWDDLFPPTKRMRARRNALQWLADRVVQKAAEATWQEQPVAGEVIDAIVLSLHAIDATLTEKDDEAPSMRPLISLFGALPRIATAEPATAPTAAPAADLPPAAARTAPAIPAAAPAPQASPPLAAALDSNLPAAAAMIVLGERVSELAQWYQGIDLENPASYRIRRIALWSAIDTAPPDQGGKTLVPGPTPQTVDVFKRLEAGGSPQEIVLFCENQLAIKPFWLDVNRLAAKALALGGPRFAPAIEAVEAETARLIERLPGLSGLRFANGQGFADQATLDWLGTLSGGRGGRTSEAAGAAPSETADAAIGDARTLFAAGKRGEAAARMQRAIAAADSAQKRFVLRLRLYELLVAQGGNDTLAPFARILMADIDRFNLDQWDPGLALDGLIVAYRALLPETECRGEVEAILARISVLDPAMALDLLGSSNLH